MDQLNSQFMTFNIIMALTGAPSWENYDYISESEEHICKGAITVSTAIN